VSAAVIDRVLSVDELRKRLKDVNDAALHLQAVIHYGERGEDQLVIISRDLFDQLMTDRIRLAAKSGPYAAFNRAMLEGQFARPSEHSPRRRTPDLSDESGVPVDDMVAAGHDDRAPRRRRHPHV
jgi:hypothetical protein